MTRTQDQEEAARALAKISCQYCGTIISAHAAQYPDHCGSQNCQTAQIVRGVNARDDQRRLEYKERQDDARTKAGAQFLRASEVLECNVDEMLVAVVPFQNEPIEPLTPESRARFQAHIERIVAEAFDAAPDAISLLNYSPGPIDEPSIVFAGCATCQGFCCKRGGGDNHAFLTRQTVYYMRQTNPELDADEVAAHYLDALPDASVRGACVYQGPEGCVLERDWRAGLCNSFHCHDLHAMHELTDGRTDVALAIVGINDDEPSKVMAFNATLGAVVIEPS